MRTAPFWLSCKSLNKSSVNLNTFVNDDKGVRIRFFDEGSKLLNFVLRNDCTEDVAVFVGVAAFAFPHGYTAAKVARDDIGDGVALREDERLHVDVLYERAV